MTETAGIDTELQELVAAYQSGDAKMVRKLADSIDGERKTSSVQKIEIQEEPVKQSFFSDFIFYAALILLLLAAFSYRAKDKVIQFAGYSYFTVLTSSMQSEIPQGSLIMVKQTAADQIEVGDDITFFREEGVSVTHRVVQIVEDYDGQGNRGFQTKGTENVMADKEIVHAGNVIGVVRYVVPAAGSVISYLSSHVVWIFIFTGLLILLTASLKVFFKNQEKMAV